MLLKKTINLILLLMFSTIIFAQDTITIKENFIAYKFPKQADSLFVLKLDSLKQDIINEHLVITMSAYSEDSTLGFVGHYIYNYSISLNYLENKKEDTTNFCSYLYRNTNHYYISKNQKYKIPIIFWFDNYYGHDYIKFPHQLEYYMGFLFLELYVKDNNVLKHSINIPIPKKYKKK